MGYRAVVPSGVIEKLGPPGSPAYLHVHTHVREDAIVLYGFASRDERACFELLIGAHGVGPAVALAMLSVHTPTALRRAVSAEDTDALMLVPGIGKKTATRLILELKSKLESADDDDSVMYLVGSAGAAGGARRADVRSARWPAWATAVTRSAKCWPWCLPRALWRSRSGSHCESWPLRDEAGAMREEGFSRGSPPPPTRWKRPRRSPFAPGLCAISSGSPS